MKSTYSLMLAAASMVVWATSATGAQAPVDLRSANNFVILSKAGISTTGVTSIVGNIGVSPIDSTAITGFSLSLDASREYSTSPQLTGKAYASDYAAPTGSILTTAIGDMQTAYTDAAGRTLPDGTELGAGDISGMTIAPGLYKWGSGVLINNEVTLEGGPNEIWIFQVAQNLTVGDGAIVHLAGGAQAANIFWQVGGEVTLGTTSHFEGILLVETAIHLNTGASINGRLLAQTAVTLDSNEVTLPEIPTKRVLKVTSISRAADGQVTLIFTVTPGHSLLLQDSTDLVNWTDLSVETPSATPYTTSHSTSLNDAKRFYRTRYQ